MMKVAIHVLFLGLTVGCSSSSDGVAPDGGGPLDAETGTSDPCSTDCERQVAAGCSRIPSGYLEACKGICAASRKSVKAECVPQFDAISMCVNTKITYSCDDTGNIRVNPIGACASEGAACVSCNGKSCNVAVP